MIRTDGYTGEQSDQIEFAASFLKTKIVVPRPRKDIVVRQRLLERLDAGVSQPLTLLCAPAGSGKTQLLSNWCANYRKNTGSSVAWFSIDGSDNDPIRFWVHVCAALQETYPDSGNEMLLLLQQLPLTTPLRTILSMHINIIAAIPHDMILILDDYHLIDEQAIHDSMTFLLTHLPPNIHILLACRVEPPLPLAQFRAKGQLADIEAIDMRFTYDETISFLRECMHLDLPSTLIEQMEQQIEGWIAGLQLAALSIHGHHVRNKSYVQNFDGTHRFVMEYLNVEVLAQQSEEVRTFLLATSILDELTAPLCNAVTGRMDAQRMLTTLEHSNLFLVPLDEKHGWYRYHHLFSEFLRSYMLQQQPERVPLLYQRASKWYESHKHMNEAIEYLLKAATLDERIYHEVADILVRVAETIWMRGEIKTLSTWLDAMPHDLVCALPRLGLYRAWTFFHARKYPEVEQWLQIVENALRTSSTSAIQEDRTGTSTSTEQAMRGEIYAIRAFIAYMRHDLTHSVEWCEQAQKLLPVQSLWRTMVLYTQSSVYISRGEYSIAESLLIEGIATGRATNAIQATVQCYMRRAYMYFECGQLYKALAICQQTLEYIGASPIARVLQAGLTYHCLSELYAEWNQLEEARRYAQECILCGEKSDNKHLILAGSVDLHLVNVAQDRYAEAVAFAEEQFRTYSAFKRPMLAVDMLRVRLWWVQNEKEAASKWLQAYTPCIEDEHDPLYIVERLMMAQMSLLLGSLAGAQQLAEHCLEIARRMKRATSIIESLCMHALILQENRATRQAIATLAEALNVAEPEGMIRTFVNYGKPMTKLLVLVLAAVQRDEAFTPRVSQQYITKLLAALDVSVPENASSHASLQLPSGRELEVLRLVASGHSDKEIAQQLVISQGTVKTHIKRIFVKLNAKNRTQAVTQARALGIL